MASILVVCSFGTNSFHVAEKLQELMPEHEFSSAGVSFVRPEAEVIRKADLIVPMYSKSSYRTLGKAGDPEVKVVNWDEFYKQLGRKPIVAYRKPGTKENLPIEKLAEKIRYALARRKGFQR